MNPILFVFFMMALETAVICYDAERINLEALSGNITSDDVFELCPNFRADRLTPKLDHALPLRFVITPNKFLSLENAVEEMSIVATISIIWDEAVCENENQLRGNGKDSILFVPPDKFWKPLVEMLGSKDPYLNVGNRGELLQVRAAQLFKGNRTEFSWRWEVAGVFTFHCELDLFLFPADVQNCSFQVRAKQLSLTYKFSQCNINYIKEQIQFITPNSNWKFIDISCSVGTGLAISSLVTVSFVMARIPRFYMLHLVAPCVLLAILGLFSFALPAKGAERTTFTMSVYLAFVFVQTMLFSILPQTPKDVLLTQMVLFQSIVMTIITIYSALVSRVARKLAKKSIEFEYFQMSWLFLMDMIGFFISILAYFAEIIWIYVKFKENYVEYEEKHVFQ